MLFLPRLLFLLKQFFFLRQFRILLLLNHLFIMAFLLFLKLQFLFFPFHICEFLVNIREIDTIIHHNGFELGKRFVDDFLQDIIRSKRNLIAPLYQDSLTGIDIHALPIFHGSNLEGTQPLHFQQLVLLDAVTSNLKHGGNKALSLSLGKSTLAGNSLCQNRQTRLTHLPPLHYLFFP